MNEPAQEALPRRTDVLVVGAGPTGLTLAVTLASAGVDFLLLDQLPEGANTSRAGVVHAHTLEVLDSVGAAAPLVDRGLRLTRAVVREQGRRLASVVFDRLPTPHPYVLMVPQYETEAVLLERLRSLGGDVRRPYTVTGVEQDPGDGGGTRGTGEAVVTVAGPRGPETVRAAYVVGADGMHSTVRRMSGIGYRGGRYAQSFALADVRMDWRPGREEVSLLFGPAGLVLVAPLPRGLFRIVATVDEAPPEPDTAFVQRLLDGRATGQARIGELVWGSRFHVHHRLADRYRAGRLLLAGDAAHVHSPAGGQGMNLGIQDAHVLGRALTAVVLDGADPGARFGAYESARRPVAGRVITLTDRITRAATARSLPVRAGRNTFLRLVDAVPALRTRLARELAQLDHR